MVGELLARVGGRLALGGVVALGCSAGLASGASALDFWDGRVQAHGFYEAQIRTLNRDFEEDWDLAQWWNVLNVEIEADLAPDGFGPFGLVSSFVRLEVRYDCVWTRACGLARSADVYGDRTDRLPARLSDGRRSGLKGNQFVGDVRPFHLAKISDLGVGNRGIPADSPRAYPFWGVQGFRTLFDQAGPDGMLGTPRNPGDDPALFVFSSLLDDDCRYGSRKTKGSSNGVGVQVLPMTPKCNIRSVGALRDKPNPFSSIDRNNVVLGGGTGGLALPFRPAPEFAFLGQGGRAPDGVAQGIFLPNERLARLLRNDDFDNFDQNFREAELQWNRGASQQDEKELKEAYLDLEGFDARLWLRIGKQNIVWGKTELFRTTDQFNPQDLGLASLPSLEESRIALWALRAVWSFWSVGPFDDVRLEVAANFDQFEPTDLGRCGEPFSPLPVCDKTFGLQAHSLAGIGIAGEVRPDDPWNSLKSIEGGARLEWRWNRFSFALIDFYGFDDRFYIDGLFRYNRNVDPFTGRPREARARGSCVTGVEAACLTPDEALGRHSLNQQVFAMICASSVAVVADLDPTACGQSIFNSPRDSDPTNNVAPPVALAFNTIFAGQPGGAALFAGLSSFNGPTPLVALNADPNDGVAPTAAEFIDRFGSPKGISFLGAGVQPFLTTEQQGLLGCGAFYQTSCDLSGVDLLNAEASVLFQSWPVFEGTFGTFWDTTDASVAQPGTVGFQGGPVATRTVDGRVVILPGARGPSDPGYDPAVDGTVGGKAQPFTGQEFQNELAILSWNFLMGSVGLSTGDMSLDTVFDPSRPFARDRCSFATPQRCAFVQDLIDLTSVGRPTVRAGGNRRFGRRDFTWAQGGDVVLRYEKRNVLGFSMDWAEDVTKSNWSVEATWIEDLEFQDQDRLDYSNEADTYNLTVSVDRPTFINFLNANRTFFFNSQLFFQWVDGYTESFTSNGPWNFLGTFTISTGYFQDRLLPTLTFVYDRRSNSGAVLPQIEYRFTSVFSATFGVAAFYGRFQEKDLELHPIGTSSTRVGEDRGSTFVENGLSAIRERDEVFLRLRYTF